MTAGLSLPGEHEQRVQQAREPVDLLLRGGELALELGAVGLRGRGLEPQPEPGQRRPQLVRRVRDELALGREHGADPLGHVVEGDRHLALLRRAGHLGPRFEVAFLDPSGRRGELAQRPRERVGEEPREHEPEAERRGADRGEGEHAAADAVVHGADALRDADRSGDPTRVGHRNRAVQEVLAERVAVARRPGRSGP